jgi:hypothetical protein
MSQTLQETVRTSSLPPRMEMLPRGAPGARLAFTAHLLADYGPEAPALARRNQRGRTAFQRMYFRGQFAGHQCRSPGLIAFPQHPASVLLFNSQLLAPELLLLWSGENARTAVSAPSWLRRTRSRGASCRLFGGAKRDDKLARECSSWRERLGIARMLRRCSDCLGPDRPDRDPVRTVA